MECNKCDKQVLTSTHYKTGPFTFLSCCVLSAFCLWCGCCLAPFFKDGFKDVSHSCPHCEQVLGVWKREKGD
ncbi:lipopolysaccharide-induced tumor necrosis factor-alpha factor homolog [Saccoglossus kowalevskii]